MIQLVTTPIDYEQQLTAARTTASGAVVLFLGTVRELSEGRPVTGLEYECYPPLAEQQLSAITTEAKELWPLHHASVTHRWGRLSLGDIAVAVVTASVHRADAFQAGQWIMDEIKHRAPIWKKELWADGTTEWVHPEGAVP